MSLQQANQLFDSNQFQQAVAIYDSLSPQDPNFFEALNNKGNCYKCLGQYQKAIEIFNQMLSYNDVSKGLAYGNLEMIYYLKDLYDFDKAQYYWQQSNNILKQIKERRALGKTPLPTDNEFEFIHKSNDRINTIFDFDTQIQYLLDDGDQQKKHGQVYNQLRLETQQLLAQPLYKRTQASNFREGLTDVEDKLLAQSKKLGQLHGRLSDEGNEEEGEVDQCGFVEKKEKEDTSEKQKKAEKTDLEQCCTIF
ncbi:hypothetical protein ABPG74_003034 [Tetrahymena malaccensis]